MIGLARQIFLTGIVGLFGASGAFAQTETPGNEPFEIILYDAETIARINDIPAEPAPPIYPRDISDQYQEFILGIPVITNPTSCNKGELEIRVTVTNVKKSKGYVVADLHNHIVEDFLDPEKVVVRVRQDAVKGTTEFCIPLSQPGDYAIAFYHDQNSDRRFNKGFLRIPKERFAMSTNPNYKKRKPYYDEVDFTVGEDGLDMTVRLVRARDLL